MTRKRVLILGGGPGGVVAANNIIRRLGGDDVEVTLVDKTGYHVFQPSQLWVMTGQREPDDIRRPLRLLERKGVKIVVDEVKAIRPENHVVNTNTGELPYDYLIVALGSVPEVSKIPGYEYSVCTPWTIEGALKCRKLLASFKKGSIVVAPLSWPYKCPPAPFEAAFMAKYLLEQRGAVEGSNVTVLHFWKEPMEPFGPSMASAFKKFMDMYGISFIGGVEVEGFEDRHVVTKREERIEYNLAIAVP